MKEPILDTTSRDEIMIRVLGINPFEVLPILFKEKVLVKSKKQKIDYPQVPEHWGRKLRLKYFGYKNRCNTETKIFDLTFDEFESLLNGICYYCGSTKVITIDRLNSDKGYIKDNVVSCCNDCNILKSFLPKNVFLKQIKRIVEYKKL